MTQKTSGLFYSTISPVITRYLALKRALGRKYVTEQAILKHLDRFLHENQAGLTPERFAQWCQTRQHLTSGVRRSWMRVARNLCLYRRRTEPICFVPDPTQFPPQHQPVQPHIFTENEVLRLLDTVRSLKSSPSSPLRKENMRLALVLFYSTGMRRGELLRLQLGNYDPLERTLLIRESKFHKSRLLPLSPDGAQELEAYLRLRRRKRISVSPDAPLLWNGYGGDDTYSATALTCNFHILFQAAGIQTAFGRRPRIHDFRHTFAVRALIRWYRGGDDVQAKLPLLSTYMGHISPVSTQYYLHFIEDLANSANERFAKRYSGLVTPFSSNRRPSCR